MMMFNEQDQDEDPIPVKSKKSLVLFLRGGFKPQLESDAAFKYVSDTISGVCSRSDTLFRASSRTPSPLG